MKMNMYWSQQEVFLMGTLSLFPEKLKNVPITPNGEWGYYFNDKNADELGQQLDKYKKAGYIDFDEEMEKVMYLNSGDAEKFCQIVISFMITKVNTSKVTDDLTQYLENWCNDKLLTNTAYKPDDSAYQHKKLLTALARAYDRQGMPHINIADIYGDNTDYESPFWETVLSPQFVDYQYAIRQMDYDMNNQGLPFVDIKITDQKLDRSLELAAKSSKPISDDDPKELCHRGLRITRDGLVDYDGAGIQLTGQETAALRALMERPGDLRPREDISIELTAKNAKPDNLGKLISSLRIKLKVVIGYNCIENKSGQGWILKIHLTE